MKTSIEPFRIRSVEPIYLTTTEERQHFVEAASYNLFSLRSEQVIIDLLTDSGTSAMSAEQWAALTRGDESYAGSASFYRFVDAVQTLMPFKHIIPTHQGRAAERILASVMAGPGKHILNNTHFDTTRANFEAVGSIAVNLPIAEGLQPALEYPFKGNIDTQALENYLKQHAAQVPLVMLTITNNAGGGQPVSLANIEETHTICRKYNKPLFIDACRFAENAYFIKLRETGYANQSVEQIVQKIFSYADGVTMSAKKDVMANIGGWLAMHDDALAEQCCNQLIISEGFPTYGGLAGRDLDAIAVGIREAINEDYLQYRIQHIQYLGDCLTAMGIPIIRPSGGHAIFIDAKKMLPHIPAHEYPGQALAVALYEFAGIRSCEMGSVMFGKNENGQEIPAPMELVRLAIPRRVYTQTHLDYVLDSLAIINQMKEKISGFRIVWEPKFLRHFTAKFEKINL